MKKALILAVAMVLMAASVSFAVIAGSQHDLTASDFFTGAQLSACQYCHTPHLRNNPAVTGAPLWNRTLPAGPYTVYGGGQTLGGTTVGQPGTNSKTCLSCHDGTIALGSVLVGVGGTINEATGRPDLIAADGSFAEPAIANEYGAYPNLGTDLSNEHPVGFTFVAGRAGVPSISAPFKLYGTGNDQFECATCHDPHDSTYTRTAGGKTFSLFLRANPNTICTDCHSQK